MKRIAFAALFVFSLFSCAVVDPAEDRDMVLQKMNNATNSREMLAVLTVGNLTRIGTIDENTIKTYMSLPREDYYLSGSEKLLGKLYVAEMVLNDCVNEGGFSPDSNFAQGDATAFGEYVIETFIIAERLDLGRNRILRDIDSADSAERVAEIFKYDDYDKGNVSTKGEYSNIALLEITSSLSNAFTGLDEDSKMDVSQAVLDNKPYSSNRIGARKLAAVFHAEIAVGIMRKLNRVLPTEMVSVLTPANLEILGVSTAQRQKYNLLSAPEKATVCNDIWHMGPYPEDDSGIAAFVAVFIDKVDQLF